jgi:hypothetical protein
MKNIIILFATATTLLISCYTPNKATKQATKAIDKFPANVLPIFRGKFPCITLDVDTVYNWYDTTIFVDCSGIILPYTKDSLSWNKKNDTIKQISIVKKIISLPQITITKIIEDSSKIKEIKLELERTQFMEKICNENLLDYQDKVKLLEGRLQKRKVWILWLIIALLSSVIINLIQKRIK